MEIVSPTKFCVTASALGFLLLAYYLCKDSRWRRRFRHKSEQRLLERIAMQDIIPEIKDPRDRQALLLHEIQRAEELMSSGKYERAVTHFANAIAICNDPHKLVMALRSSLPAHTFDLLLKVLANSYGKRINARFWDTGGLYSVQPKRLCASTSYP